LLDLALWSLDYPEIEVIESVLVPGNNGKEEQAFALLKTPDGIPVSLNCSWNTLQDSTSDIHITVDGSQAGASFRNINGSCYDFEIIKFCGDHTEILFNGVDDWAGRQLIDWSRRMVASTEYDPKIESILHVAKTIDKIYDAAS
jgi:predicted dehydrogenase